MYISCILPEESSFSTASSRELRTPWADHHHLTCITYKHAVYMRCHYKNNSIIYFQTYSKHIPLRSYVSKYILPRSHVHPVHIFIISPVLHISMQFIWDVIIKKINHRFPNLFQSHPSKKLCIQVHPFEEPCTPSTSFRGVMYPKHILPRSYVLQGHTSIISPTLHTSMSLHEMSS